MMFVMRLFFFCLMIIFLLPATRAQTAETYVNHGMNYEKQLNESMAYKSYQDALRLQPQHLYALIRCSELASRIGKLQKSEAAQQKYYQDALNYARRALKINPNDSDANLVLSIAYGRLALLKSGSEKVAYVKEIKSYAEKSLYHNRSNFKALHVLGKWHYEVSNLNFIELAAVRVFYGGLPDASLDSSIYFYERAKALAPAFSLNYLELAKARNRNGETRVAVGLLRKIFTLPASSSEDGLIRAEANRLINSWED